MDASSYDWRGRAQDRGWPLEQILALARLLDGDGRHAVTAVRRDKILLETVSEFEFKNRIVRHVRRWTWDLGHRPAVLVGAVTAPDPRGAWCPAHGYGCSEARGGSDRVGCGAVGRVERKLCCGRVFGHREECCCPPRRAHRPDCAVAARDAEARERLARGETPTTAAAEVLDRTPAKPAPLVAQASSPPERVSAKPAEKIRKPSKKTGWKLPGAVELPGISRPR